MLAFSTNWNASRHKDGAAIIDEILGLGFDTVELGHGLSKSLLHGIHERHARGDFRVGSVHNFCPMPVEILADNPDCYEFTSKKSRERERASKLTLHSMATAKAFGARHVVLHLGRIATLDGLTDGLLDLLRARGVADRSYNRAKLAQVLRREKEGPSVIRSLVRVLEPLVEEAVRLGLVLVAENRSDFEAVPTEREMLSLLKEFDSPHFRYWHDFGHAQMRENMGLLDHAQWLEQVAPYAAGAHLQDAGWPDRDHLPPFHGMVDFPRLMPILPPGIPFVLELSHRNPPDTILESAARWRETFPA